MWPFRSKRKGTTAQSRGPSDFGPFGTLFGPDTLYLSLLHMMREKSREACSAISELMASDVDTSQYVRLMLADVDWRPHLVACVAALTARDRSEYADPLWEAFDAGSWVAPQLAVTLSFCDPEFEESAKRRISARCPVSPSTGMNAVERHSATGPAGTAARSGKNMASLFEVLSIIQADANWLSAERSKAKVRKLLDEDFDNSAEIARHWMKSTRASLKTFGVGLEHQD